MTNPDRREVSGDVVIDALKDAEDEIFQLSGEDIENECIMRIRKAIAIAEQQSRVIQEAKNVSDYDLRTVLDDTSWLTAPQRRLLKELSKLDTLIREGGA